MRVKYGITFPIVEKVEVNGVNCHPVFNYIRQNSRLFDKKKDVTTNIGWNIGNFLVNKEGHVVEYYDPTVEPLSIVKDIRKLTEESKLKDIILQNIV